MVRQVLFGYTAISVLCGAVIAIFPKNSRTVPYVRFLSSLILLLMLLSPLQTVLSTLHLTDPGTWFTGAADGESTYWEEAVVSSTTARAEASLAALLSAEVGIPAEDIGVTLTTQTTCGAEEVTVSVTAVTVVLYRRAYMIAADKLAAAAERTMLCPCTVVLSEEEHA